MNLEPCPKCDSKAISMQGISPHCFILCNACAYSSVGGVNEREVTFWWNYESRSAKAGRLMQIKPCPFCGIIPKLDSDYHGKFSIRCGNAECFVIVEVLEPTEKQAVEVWNRRAK